MTQSADLNNDKLPPQESREPHIDQKIKNLSDVFSLLGSDPDQNIHIIVQQACHLLEGSSAMYNRQDERNGSLECWAGCNLPAGYAAAGSSQGHVCNETIQKTELEPVAIEDLSQTPYGQSDPAIRRHGFTSYLGHPVVCKGKTVGSLCILDTRRRAFTDVDTYIISTLARSLALEEERKLAEKEQLRLTARLQQAQKMESIATLAGGIAHQFNNALAVILGNIELIQMDGLVDQRLLRFIEPINQAGQKMVHLTAQLLAYARGGKFQTQVVSAHRFVKEALSLVSHSLSSHVELKTDLDETTDPIEVDGTQIQMLLAAILANASEAIETKGYVTVSLRNAELSAEDRAKYAGLKPGRHVLLQIADTGKGMDERTRTRIFEPFFTTKFQGRGLGMAAVYGIVKKHGGNVYVDSEPGHGAVVSIFLPGAMMAREEAEKRTAAQTQRTGTALIVEDEHLVMEVNRAIVEKLGYRVLEAKSGHEALHIARTYKGPIDFALLDVILPDMGGNQIYPKLMELLPNLKVIVCSGFTLDDPAREILNAGAQAFLPKPFSVAVLSKSLDEIFKKA